MPKLKHKYYGSLALQLNDDEQITLGARETKHISDEHFKSAGVQKALQQGLITVLPEEEQTDKQKSKK